MDSGCSKRKGLSYNHTIIQVFLSFPAFWFASVFLFLCATLPPLFPSSFPFTESRVSVQKFLTMQSHHQPWPSPTRSVSIEAGSLLPYQKKVLNQGPLGSRVCFSNSHLLLLFSDLCLHMIQTNYKPESKGSVAVPSLGGRFGEK